MEKEGGVKKETDGGMSKKKKEHLRWILSPLNRAKVDFFQKAAIYQ